MLRSKILMAVFLSLIVPAINAKTVSFELDGIQEFIAGPNAVHPMEYPIGDLEGLATVVFSIAYVNENLVFYATMDESPDAIIEFNIEVGLYHNHNQKIGYIRLAVPRVVQPKSESSRVGANFFKVEGNLERLKKADLEDLTDLRLEVTWFDRFKTQ